MRPILLGRYPRRAASGGVDGQVPRVGRPRTVSGPEGSSTQRRGSSDAVRPGRSLRPGHRSGARRVGHFSTLPIQGAPARPIRLGLDGVAVPQAPPTHVRGRRRPGAHRAHLAGRRRAGSRGARVPLRGAARDGQDVAGEDPRQGAQLRARADAHAGWHVRALHGDPRGALPRRHRARRRLEPRDRHDPRDGDRTRVTRADRGWSQDLHPRRGPLADGRRVERPAQDARGAAREGRLHPLHHGRGQVAADGALALPAVHLPPPGTRASSRPCCDASQTPSRSRRPTPRCT